MVKIKINKIQEVNKENSLFFYNKMTLFSHYKLN